MNQRVAAWLTWLEHEKGREPTTRKLYERTVLMLERETAGSGPVEKLETGDLRAWLHTKSGSTASYGNRVAALRSFYGYLFERKMLLEDPSRRLEIPRRVSSAREPVRDLEAVLTVLDRLDERVGRRVGESRDMADFLAQTGIRISDACALTLTPPVPEQISIPRGRRPDRIVNLTPLARGALNRLGGRFGIGARALQRRFEKADFHPDQLRHWHRVNLAEPDLRDKAIEPGFRDFEASLADSSSIPGTTATTSPTDEGGPAVGEPLSVVGRFLRMAEEVTVVLVREARKEGKSWDEIAHALLIPESIAKKRFAS